MVCPGNMCMATVHRGDNNVVVVVVVVIIIIIIIKEEMEKQSNARAVHKEYG